MALQRTTALCEIGNLLIGNWLGRKYHERRIVSNLRLNVTRFTQRFAQLRIAYRHKSIRL